MSTPLMRQYWEIKAAHADKILFFRMGDFYEMFFDDAVKAAPILGIALTSRNKKAQDETPMCGLPHHSVAGPINKLLAHGLKVAICDQIEDPKLAKGIVKRAVTRILTPGMVFDPDTLEATSSHYLAALDQDSISFIETTTGEAFFFTSSKSESLKRLLSILPVAEFVGSTEQVKALAQEHVPFVLSVAEDLSQEQNNWPDSAKRLWAYVQSLGGSETLQRLKPFESRELQNRMDLSPTVLRHLEVFSTYKGDMEGSLFKAINRTQTSSGARLLRQWLAFPLRDHRLLTARQDRVEKWKNNLLELKVLRQALSEMGDIERRLGRISSPQCHARDLQALAGSLRAAVAALRQVEKIDPIFEKEKFDGFAAHAMQLVHEVERVFVDEPPLQTRQGYMINRGVSPILDELITLSQDSQGLLSQMEARERESTGISSLKIRYNNVFGYYIEITNTHKDKAPAHYLRKQTLANAERYCTDELIELEKKVLSAQAKRNDLEFEIFESLRKKALQGAQDFLSLAFLVSDVDVVSSLAWLAIEQKYVRPSFSQNRELDIVASRHPVIEQTLRSPFIANDIALPSHSCMLLTGPNMAGKSTLMRQLAVTAILAQMGSFVPADRAALPIFDRIYTRIGASDQLTEGLSTFMVEMKETAEMLSSCTEDSLVVLDEVGRGTATFDGMSLAQAILEYLLSEVRPLTLFATHYHELTQLQNNYAQLFNYHMSVVEKEGAVKFMHSLVSGPAEKSYGIYVAELAGLPSQVTRRAKSILKGLEASKVQVSSQLSFLDMAQPSQAESAVSEARTEYAALIEEIKGLSLSHITPIDALNTLAQWQKKFQ